MHRVISCVSNESPKLRSTYCYQISCVKIRSLYRHMYIDPVKLRTRSKVCKLWYHSILKFYIIKHKQILCILVLIVMYLQLHVHVVLNLRQHNRFMQT